MGQKEVTSYMRTQPQRPHVFPLEVFHSDPFGLKFREKGKHFYLFFQKKTLRLFLPEMGVNRDRYSASIFFGDIATWISTNRNCNLPKCKKFSSRNPSETKTFQNLIIRFSLHGEFVCGKGGGGRFGDFIGRRRRVGLNQRWLLRKRL